MHFFTRILQISLCLIFVIPSAWAFDNDFEINRIDLGEENFLDIKASSYRKSLEYDWFDSTSGWRLNIASLDSDLAFTQTEIKLQKTLSEYVNIRLDVAQEVFYADKEFPLPTIEAEVYPWAGDLGFSAIGTPAYGKREMDLGFAVIWGKRPWNYTRFEFLDVDRLYNEKNEFDNTFYSKGPTAMKLEGAYDFGRQLATQSAKRYKLRFAISQNTPLELIDPDNNGTFKHKANDYYLLFDYQPTADSVIGITINGFTLRKSNVQNGESLQQATDYLSVDVYWVTGMHQLYEFRVGTQYDHLGNDLRDFIDSNNDLDYSTETIQLYSTVYHPFTEHMAWDIGLYLGHVKEQEDFLFDNSRDRLKDGIAAKLRFGFEYSSADGASSLQFNVSLNLDDPINDPGDGGSITFQSVF